jgi:hypothetical protein
MMVAKSKKNSIGKATYTVLIHLILPIWVRVNSGFFGMEKEKIKNREFHIVQDILHYLTEIWNNLTFEDVQSMSREWQIRLNWVMENGGEYYFE